MAVQSSNNDPNIPHLFKVYAALDFGTDGTGLAYSLPGKDKVYMHDKWRNLGSNKNDALYDEVASIKPKTAILLDQNGKFQAFGDAALQTYMLLHNNSLMLFEHFKMNLYNKPHHSNQNNDNNNDDDKKNDTIDIDNNKRVIKDTLTAMNGKSFPASIVFIEALKHLKKEAMHVFRRKRSKLGVKTIRDVCWVLTVPAIWDDVAKAKMKNWAYAAGMIDKDIDNHLLLQYEPDCASLSIQHEFDTSNNIKKLPSKFRKNVKYILIDAGGGTVDIACHKVVGNNSVKELMHPSGGPWGDMYVDHRFLDIIHNMFSKEWVEEFKRTEPNYYLQILDNFRRAKWNFTGESSISEWHHIQLPVPFIEFLDDKFLDDDNKCDDIEDYVNDFIHNDVENGFNLDGDRFKMHFKIWKTYLFDPYINPTIEHCKTLLSHSNMSGTKYICIVGGFGGVGYFQNRIKKTFGKRSTFKLGIIIPKRPMLSVLDGAARMARLMVANSNNNNNNNQIEKIVLQPFIKSRRMAYTYGVCYNAPMLAVKGKIPDDHIQKHTYVDYKKKKYVRNVFRSFCQINQEIKHGEKIKYNLSRAGPNQKQGAVQVYSTQALNQLTLDQTCTNLGQILIDFNQDDNDDESVIVEFHFYGSQIEVFGYRARNNSKGEPLKLVLNS